MDLKPKKSLGQHFLQSHGALASMCDAGDVQVGDLVLEIGPGKGALTAELLARGACVVAVEKDHSLIPMLQVSFDKEIADGRLRIMEGDALEMSVEELVENISFLKDNSPHPNPLLKQEKERELRPLLSEERAGGEVYEFGMLRSEMKLELEPEFTSPQPSPRLGEGALKNPQPQPFKIIANIPYYITGALLEHFLSAKVQPTTLVFLIQKEVAERIARSKKESLLSLSVKVYGEPKYIKTVPAGAFSPPPKIDSAILAIKHISRKNFENEKHEEIFFKIIRAGFSHKRKLLSSNLKPLLGENTEELLTKSNIPPKSRAEDVSLENWLVLAKK